MAMTMVKRKVLITCKTKTSIKMFYVPYLISEYQYLLYFFPVIITPYFFKICI